MGISLNLQCRWKAKVLTGRHLKSVQTSEKTVLDEVFGEFPWHRNWL